MKKSLVVLSPDYFLSRPESRQPPGLRRRRRFHITITSRRIYFEILCMYQSQLLPLAPGELVFSRYILADFSTSFLFSSPFSLKEFFSECHFLKTTKHLVYQACKKLSRPWESDRESVAPGTAEPLDQYIQFFLSILILFSHVITFSEFANNRLAGPRMMDQPTFPCALGFSRMSGKT